MACHAMTLSGVWLMPGQPGTVGSANAHYGPSRALMLFAFAAVLGSGNEMPALGSGRAVAPAHKP
jgi:hypothetical protein